MLGKRIFLILFAGLSVVSAQAANVRWGMETIEQVTDPYGGYQWTFWAEEEKHFSCLNFFFTRTTSGRCLVSGVILPIV